MVTHNSKSDLPLLLELGGLMSILKRAYPNCRCIFNIGNILENDKRALTQSISHDIILVFSVDCIKDQHLCVNM